MLPLLTCLENVVWGDVGKAGEAAHGCGLHGDPRERVSQRGGGQHGMRLNVQQKPPITFKDNFLVTPTSVEMG